jgi:hypothetical protein
MVGDINSKILCALRIVVAVDRGYVLPALSWGPHFLVGFKQIYMYKSI